LAIRVVPPGDTYNGNGIKGTWRLVTLVPRQVVWKHILPSGLRAAPDDNADTTIVCFDVRGLRGFCDTLKVGLLDIP